MRYGTERLRRVQEWSRVTDRALESCDVTETKIASQLQRNRKQVRRWRDQEHVSSITLSDIAALPPEAIRVIASELAALIDCDLAHVPDSVGVNSDIRTLAEVAKECADVVATYGEALADGHLTAQETKQVEGEINEAIVALLSLRQRCAQVQKERVVGVTV